MIRHSIGLLWRRERHQELPAKGHSVRGAGFPGLPEVFPLLVAFTALGISGCDHPPAERSSVAVPVPPVPSAAPSRLTLLAMEDYIDQAILKEFEKETGIGIDHVTYEAPESVIPLLRSKPGSADMVIVDSFTIKDLRELKLAFPLQHDQLPNIENLDPQHRKLPFDPHEEVSLPYHWGTTLIAYRRDRLPSPEQSWRLLWNPSLKGQVMMLDDSFESMAVAMILNQVDAQTPNESGYRQAADMLLQHVHDLKVRYGTDDEVKQALVDGTVTAAMCYSGDAAIAAAENPDIDFFIPEEGAMIWVDCMAICRDTQNPTAAHQFFNFLLRPEIAARNAAAINYAPANHAAESLLPPTLKNDPRLYPPPILRAKLQHVPVLDEKMDALARRYWHQFRSGLLDSSNQDDSDCLPERQARANPSR